MRSQQVQAAESSDGRVVSILYKDGLFHDKPAMRERLWAKGPMKAFLPEGYPGSVTADYASFQLWDSIQAVCSYVRGILSSQAMLTGVGVGQQAATPLSAVFQFFLRDLSGMLGGVTFAFLQGSKLDVYAKQWRLFADCLNNVGLVMELASPVFPSVFLTLACLGSIARAITGVAAGSTRAALTLHFAKQNNAADVSAKEGTQETATTLVGMLLGMAFTHAFNVCRCTMVDLGELSQLDSSACVRQHPGSARAHTHLAQPITPAAPGRHLLPQGCGTDSQRSCLLGALGSSTSPTHLGSGVKTATSNHHGHVSEDPGVAWRGGCRSAL